MPEGMSILHGAIHCVMLSYASFHAGPHRRADSSRMDEASGDDYLMLAQVAPKGTPPPDLNLISKSDHEACTHPRCRAPPPLLRRDISLGCIRADSKDALPLANIQPRINLFKLKRQGIDRTAPRRVRDSRRVSITNT